MAVIRDQENAEQMKVFVDKLQQVIKEEPPFIEIRVTNHLDPIISAILLSAVLAEKGVPHAIRKRPREQNEYPFFPQLIIEVEQNLLNTKVKKQRTIFKYYRKSREEVIEEHDEVMFLDDIGLAPPDEISFSILTYRSFESRFKDPKFRLLALLSSIGAPLFFRRGIKGLFASLVAELEELKVIEIKKGIIFPCKEGLDLHESLSLVLEPQLDGLSLNEESCLDLFIKAGIPTRDGEEWRKPVSLDDDELTLLNDKIIEFYSLSKGLRFPKTLLRDQFIDMNRLFTCSTLNDLVKISWSLMHREEIASLFKFITGEQQLWFKRGKEILKEDLLFYAAKVKELTKKDLELFEGVYGFNYDEIISYENFYALCVFLAETVLMDPGVLVGVSFKPEPHAIVIGTENEDERIARLMENIKTNASRVHQLSKHAWVVTLVNEEGVNALLPSNE